MDTFDPAPEGRRERWQEGTDTFGRVYDVLLGTATLTSYTDIADLADCSPNAAKKHLDRLAGMGIARGDTESKPARYARHEGYLEWQEARRIAQEQSPDEIVERVRRLEAKREAYERRFDTMDPASVSVFDHGDHERVHERMEAIGEWEGIVRDIRLYELAHQLARNDGHLVSA
jgi:hypothetical protein